MKTIHSIAFVLVIIGGLNWLLIGLFNWGIANISTSDAWGVIVKIIYVLVGLSAIYLAVTHRKDCKNCEPSAPTAPQM